MKSTFHKIETSASPITYVSLNNLKVHLGIFEDNGEDTYLTSLLTSAIDLVSEYISQDLGSTVRTEFFNKLDNNEPLELHRRDATSLTVKYYDNSDSLVVLSSSLYVVDSTTSTNVVRFKKSAVLPTDTSENIENFVVVGYTSEAIETQIPEVILQAIYMYCTEMYQNRAISSEKNMKTLPLSAERLLAAYKPVRV